MSVITDQRSPNTERSTPAPARLAVEPPTTSRRQRIPELAVGVLLVVGCALAALMLAAGSRDRTPVVALARGVARGQVLTDADLSVVYVESDSLIATTPGDDQQDLVGRSALSDLPAGALVTADQFGDPVQVLEPGSATVGLSVEAGQLPSLRLAPGDEVSVVAGGDPASGREPGRVVRSGLVVSVQELTEDAQMTGQRRWWVAIRAPQSEADALGAVVAEGARVQLVLVAG